jgi:hypothetical protein
MTSAERMYALMQECRKAPTQTPHERFSTALGCLRSHVYDFRLLDEGKWPAIVDRPARWNFAAMTGSAVGWLIESAAERLGAKTQHATVLDGIHGDLDIEWPDSIWDLKWSGDYAWREAKKRANEKHVGQVNAYAVARNKPRWALIYLPIAQLGKGEALEYVIHEGAADAEKARQDVTDRWAEVRKHREAGTLPEREVERETCFRLQCMHRSYCWE